MSILTWRQRRILFAIRDLTAANHGRPPTIREIGKAAGLTSTSSVAHHVRQLTTLGHLVGDPGIPRSVRIADDRVMRIEVAPEATGDAPMWAVAQIHETLKGRDPACADLLDGFDVAALACADYLTRVATAWSETTRVEVAS